MENEDASAANALSSIISVLSTLDKETQQRIIKAVTTFLDLELDGPYVQLRRDEQSAHVRQGRPSFSADTSPNPKNFLLEKDPQTDAERVACLSYYLTHYRGIPIFKTLDLAKLNTESAQPKFSNLAYSTAEAANLGYLSPFGGGMKLSEVGDQLVGALPDREAAKAAIARARQRKATRRKA